MTSDEQPRRCCARLWTRFHDFPCGARAKVEREGKHYCGKHDPVVLVARRAARQSAADAKWERERVVAQAKRDAVALVREIADTARDMASGPLATSWGERATAIVAALDGKPTPEAPPNRSIPPCFPTA